MSDNWYARHPAKALNGSKKMNLELRGLYFTLLDMFYDEGGCIPNDDPAANARACGCSTRKYNSLLKELIEAGKIVEIEGYITNKTVLSSIKNGFISDLSLKYRVLMNLKPNENKAVHRPKKERNKERKKKRDFLEEKELEKSLTIGEPEKLLYDLIAKKHGVMVWRNLYHGRVRVDGQSIIVTDPLARQQIQKHHGGVLAGSGFRLVEAA